MLGLPEEARVLLHFGWDWNRKGGDLFVSAVDALQAQLQDDKLVAITVGAGQQDTTLTSGGPDSRIRVLDPREDVRTFYAARTSSSLRAERRACLTR